MKKDGKREKTAVLLSEGSSLTARETLTALGLSDIDVDILSCTGFAITVFSKWKRRMIRTKNVNRQPEEYLDTVSGLLQTGEYAALIPTHETAWLFAEGWDYLPKGSAVPVVAREAFAKVQGKISFALLADEIGIPQPRWRYFEPGQEQETAYPCWLKADYGTAGRSVYRLNSPQDIHQGVSALSQDGNGLMLQEHIQGKYGQVQAVFDRGRLIAAHTSLQRALGVGGSAAARVSVDAPKTVEHIRRLGEHTGWHGGLTLDFLWTNDEFYYLECNPRMVEPANAALAGVSLPKLLIDLAAGKTPEKPLFGRPGVKTHSTMAMLLGAAENSHSRRAVLRLFMQSLREKGVFQGSEEVLTPWKKDPRSMIPLLAVLLQLLVRPQRAEKLAAATVDNYCIRPDTIERMRKNKGHG